MTVEDQKQKLGKGLDSLITDFKELEMIEKENMNLHDRIDYLPLNMIMHNENQPRKHFDEEKLQQLADSIKEYGFINPVVVAPKPQSNHFMIVAGERRFRAAQILGMTEIPVLMKSALKNEVLNALALLENIQREDLDPLEEALCLEQLIKDYKCSHDEIAKKLGKSRAYITNALRLLTLPKSVKDALKSGLITPSHARVVVGLKDPEKHADYIMSNKLSVRDAELYAREIQGKRSREARDLDDVEGDRTLSKIRSATNNNQPKYPRERINKYKILNQALEMGDLDGIEENLSDALDMEVVIEDEDNIARMVITFRSLEDLDLLIQRLAHEKNYPN